MLVIILDICFLFQIHLQLERWEEALQDYEVLRRLMPDDLEVSRGLFDVQVAIRKSRGEEVHRMKFGGNVEEVLGDEQFHDAVRSPGKNLCLTKIPYHFLKR